MAVLVHGGDAAGYILEYGKKPLDLSANCNPLGIPKSVVRAVADAASDADAYPDPLCRELCSALSRHEGIPESYILCGCGAADLIFRAVLSERPARALVTAPAFSEYEAALSAVGCEVSHFMLTREKGFRVTEEILSSITPELDMMFICNPNNPTGITVARPLMDSIADRCRDNGVTLILDECFNGFLDCPEENSLVPRLGELPNLVILKAFTKVYGMAGLRLGYCLCSDGELIERMRAAGQPWSVSSVAQAAGVAALSETEYVDSSRSIVKREREYLKSALLNNGCTVLGGEANYIFFYCPSDLAAHMRERGILIRDCGNYVGLGKGYYRIAVRTHGENEKFVSALSDV